MTVTTVIEFAVWGVLIAESIIAAAMLLSGLSFRFRSAAARKSLAGQGREYLRRLGQIRTVNDRDVRWRFEDFCHLMAERPEHDGDAQVVCCLLARRGGYDAVEATVGLHIGRLERGVICLCSFLARTAPLAGLAGTLVGIQQALGMFASTGDPQSVISGFAVAIETTLIGVLIAMMALSTSRLLWEPPLKRRMDQLLEFALAAQPIVEAIMRRIARLRKHKPPGKAQARPPQIRPIPRPQTPKKETQRDDAA